MKAAGTAACPHLFPGPQQLQDFSRTLSADSTPLLGTICRQGRMHTACSRSDSSATLLVYAFMLLCYAAAQEAGRTEIMHTPK